MPNMLIKDTGDHLCEVIPRARYVVLITDVEVRHFFKRHAIRNVREQVEIIINNY